MADIVKETIGSRLGFGISGPLGEKWFSESKVKALVDAAIAGGVNRFDTAGFYGVSEMRLGNALREYEAIKVCTKTGTKKAKNGTLAKDFSEASIRADVETSLRVFERECIDLLYLHGPTWTEVKGSAEILEALKNEGKIAAVGVCGSGETLERAVQTKLFDAVMGPYNLINRENEKVFRLAKELKMETAAIKPLAQGIFDPSFFKVKGPSDAWRVARGYFQNRGDLEQARKVRPKLTAIEGWTPAQAALGFVLAQDFIDIAYTTTTRKDHLTDSILSLIHI